MDNFQEWEVLLINAGRDMVHKRQITTAQNESQLKLRHGKAKVNASFGVFQVLSEGAYIHIKSTI